LKSFPISRSPFPVGKSAFQIRRTDINSERETGNSFFLNAIPEPEIQESSSDITGAEILIPQNPLISFFNTSRNKLFSSSICMNA
jgi:hypothetical protein